MEPTETEAYRVETDTLGEVRVPAEVYWGAQTQRSLDNFRLGREAFPASFVHEYARLKRVAAEVNSTLGELDSDLASYVVRAAREVESGRLDDSFPIGVWQSGSGTQTNMNLNEVIAGRANELATGTRGGKSPVHPNDHVNRGQSTNDTFPTAMHLTTAMSLSKQLRPALHQLIETLDRKSREFGRILKIGRTHLQDATPLTLGQEVGGWGAQLRLADSFLASAQPLLLELPIGGTAVGTGLNAHPRFAELVCARLASETELPVRCARSRFAGMAGHEAMAAVSGALATLAGALHKIANDVRWLGSGPRCGIGELRLPPNEPGSSIMPGKVNPSQAEALIMVCLQVFGNHSTVQYAASQGSFELNTCKPLILSATMQSIELLAGAMQSFDTQCLRGIEANEEAISQHLERSLMRVTALVPRIGYDAAARIARAAHDASITLREAAVDSGEISGADFDELMERERRSLVDY